MMKMREGSGSTKVKIGIIIPACDEEQAVGPIVEGCLREAARAGSARVVVCDNDSRDQTALVARDAGAEVVFAAPRGYGRACLAAVQHLNGWPDILLFIDADGSSRPEEMHRLLQPIFRDRADLVIGIRPPSSAMTFAQRWGNWLSVRLIAWRWRRDFSDLGPFRAIRSSSYQGLGMRDLTWGWTVEMQILALLRGVRVAEVPVSWDRRLAGVSKISGTISGVLRAGAKILWTIGRYWFQTLNPLALPHSGSPVQRKSV